MLMKTEVYLGDGLYASWDGYQIKLRAPRMEGDHEIYMEPEVIMAFKAYLKTIEPDEDKAP